MSKFHEPKATFLARVQKKAEEVLKNSTFHVRITDRQPVNKPHIIEILMDGSVVSVTEEKDWMKLCRMADSFGDQLGLLVGNTSPPNLHQGEDFIWRKEFPHMTTKTGNFSKRCKCFECKPNQAIDDKYNYSVHHNSFGITQIKNQGGV